MSEFEKWLEENYPIAGLDMCEKEGDRYTHKPIRNMHDAYLAGQQAKEAAIQEMDQVIKMQDADLRKCEKQIEGLKAQLNNMETCYIQVKKERDELEAAKRDYVCDCGYLDSPDYEECDCRKHSEDLANEVIAEIVKKANFAGLEELLDELKCRAIKRGVLLNKQALRGEP